MTLPTAPDEVPTARAGSELEHIDPEIARQAAKSMAEPPARPTQSTVARSTPESLLAVEPEALRVEAPARRREAPDPAPAAPQDEPIDADAPQSPAPRAGVSPMAPAPISADAHTSAPDAAPPTADPVAPTALPQPDTRSLPDEAVRPAPPPARLAVPVWLERLTPGSDRAVQVGLGEDGAVRLQTLRQSEGLTVQIQFTDPELQALAGVHADRLRLALETHFAEPVRLALPDGLAADAGTTDSGASGQDSATARQRDARSASSPRAADADLPSQTPTHSPLTGRREWVG